MAVTSAQTQASSQSAAVEVSVNYTSCSHLWPLMTVELSPLFGTSLLDDIYPIISGMTK